MTARGTSSADLPRMTCERCGQPYRQVLSGPFGLIVQDWHARPGQPARYVAELDPDVCHLCEDEIVEAIEAYEAAIADPEITTD